MAAVWDNEVKAFVVSTTNILTVSNLNHRDYGNVNAYFEFDVTIDRLEPNTDYKIYNSKVEAYHAGFGNNNGWNATPNEEDLTSHIPLNGYFSDDVASIEFTTSAAGSAQVTVRPTFSGYSLWSWSSTGLNFYDGESPLLSDPMSVSIYLTGIKDARYSTTTDNAVSMWDSILKYNNSNGYYIRDDRYYVRFLKTTEFTLEAREVSNVDLGFRTKVSVTLPWDFQVWGDPYPQNADGDYSQPQLVVPVFISDSELDQVWSPLTTTVEQAIIPYNNTTEREVVHLDYRIKSTD